MATVESVPQMEARLPVLESVQMEAWSEWREVESDLWEEAVALRRHGWSEVRWRRWMKWMDAERRERLVWCEMVEAWSRRRWEGCMGGRSRAEEAVFIAMTHEEAMRRLEWNLDTRVFGFGYDQNEWYLQYRLQFIDWGLTSDLSEED